MSTNHIQELLAEFDQSVTYEQGSIKINDPVKLREKISRLAEISALESGPRQGWARLLTRMIAQKLGIFPASINELYMARGRGEVPGTFTTPAFNLRVLSFEAAKAVFRVANSLDASSFIFEIARSEMNYTEQRPTEYSTSILAAAIAEGYTGPVFIQGDHFQVSSKRYGADPEAEIEALKALMREAIAAGFFNIDVDTSTMVDLDQTTIPAQQALNTSLSAMFTYYIRSIQPENVMISVGGEIGEVGGHNSTETELRAYLDGYNEELGNKATSVTGLSKISIQTGTSHGGVVLPDGSIAEVSVDFDTMKKLSQISQKDYGMGGAVQHGASTLPENAFGKFVEANACEIHLATNFMNIFFDLIPADLRKEMYAYLDKNNAGDRKAGMTDEQFYYKTRKSAVGAFKKQSWGLPAAEKNKVGAAWEAQFQRLFKQLNLAGTRRYTDKFIKPVYVQPSQKEYLGEAVEAENVSDLAD
jgi:fructose/tagatose bisphosphate aldolase